MSNPATIEDVARLADVSIATVSRAIHTPEKVAKTTRQRVNQALHGLSDAGLIRIEYGGLRVLDLQGLRRFA